MQIYDKKDLLNIEFIQKFKKNTMKSNISIIFQIFMVVEPVIILFLLYWKQNSINGFSFIQFPFNRFLKEKKNIMQEYGSLLVKSSRSSCSASAASSSGVFFFRIRGFGSSWGCCSTCSSFFFILYYGLKCT